MKLCRCTLIADAESNTCIEGVRVLGIRLGQAKNGYWQRDRMDRRDVEPGSGVLAGICGLQKLLRRPHGTSALTHTESDGPEISGYG